jgi:hypothetical protein
MSDYSFRQHPVTAHLIIIIRASILIFCATNIFKIKFLPMKLA